MRGLAFMLMGGAVLGCATGGARQALGTDPTLLPVVPWQEFDRNDFAVELPRPGHVAVLRLIRTSGANSLTLVYPDSTTPAVPARRIEVTLPQASVRRNGPITGPQQRMVRHCIAFTEADGADSLTRYNWACGWHLETVHTASRTSRHRGGLSQVYYLVMAFDTPQSVEALRAAAAQVNAEVRPREVAQQLGTALFGSEAGGRWGATLHFVP